MVEDRRVIGMDRPVQLDWLDAVAGKLAAGASVDEAREFAWGLLEGVVAGEKSNSARGKTLTVLSRIWLKVPPSRVSMRDDALRAMGEASAEERLGIHWAMTSAAYPFFVDIAANVGKLLALNDTFTVGQMNRRLYETWGERSTVKTAAQRVVRMMQQWGVLEEDGKHGEYAKSQNRLSVRPEVSALVVEGLILAKNSGGSLHQLLSHSATFPFELKLNAHDLRGHERLRVHRQGDQRDFVEWEAA